MREVQTRSISACSMIFNDFTLAQSKLFPNCTITDYLDTLTITYTVCCYHSVCPNTPKYILYERNVSKCIVLTMISDVWRE